VSETTGYPTDVLDPDLDLEADLSIDSIKRLEIVGRLAGHPAVEKAGSERDALLEQLSTLKTLRAIAEWLEPSAAAARDDAASRPAEISGTIGTPPTPAAIATTAVGTTGTTHAVGMSA